MGLKSFVILQFQSDHVAQQWVGVDKRHEGASDKRRPRVL